jgi:uncharacterized protein (TIGR02246 family)
MKPATLFAFPELCVTGHQVLCPSAGRWRDQCQDRAVALRRDNRLDRRGPQKGANRAPLAGGYTARMMRMLLVLCLALASPATAHVPGRQSADDAAIKAVVRAYVNARELRDPSAIEGLFTVDADQHTTSGEWRRGRGEVTSGSLASSSQNPGDRSITVETVRLITPDVAIADGPYEITTGGSVRRMWTTIVLARQEGRWRITAIRNMVPATIPAGSAR